MKYKLVLMHFQGCARISQAAAKEVWKHLQVPGPCPSIFQARIGPWKGIWFLDGQEDDQVWIEVNDSQSKFKRHREDLTDEC